MSYSSEVLADSPWGYWKTDETSGTSLADSSGNARPMTVQNGPPTFAQTGPDGSTADAILWTNTINQYAVTSATSADGSITMEAWVNLPANPTSLLGVMARSIGIYSSGASDGELTIDSTGHAGWMVFDGGSNRFLADPNPLSLNTPHYLAGVVGPSGGMVLYVDGAPVDSRPASTTAYTGASQLIFMRAGGSRCASVSAIEISRGAYYASESSAARIAARYAAGTSSPGSSGTASITLSGSAAGRAAGSAAGSLTLAGSGTASGSAGPSAATATASLTLSGTAVALPLYSTDTSNALDGLDITFTGTASVERPPAPVPSGLVLAEKYDKAIAYPPPVMDNGRPT